MWIVNIICFAARSRGTVQNKFLTSLSLMESDTQRAAFFSPTCSTFFLRSNKFPARDKHRLPASVFSTVHQRMSCFWSLPTFVVFASSTARLLPSGARWRVIDSQIPEFPESLRAGCTPGSFCLLERLEWNCGRWSLLLQHVWPQDVKAQM